MAEYQQMIDFLQNAKNLLIVGHRDPDADCIGSMLGLYHLFGGGERGWLLVLEDEIPKNLRYMPGSGLILNPAQLAAETAAVLYIDCGDALRASTGWLDAYAALPHYCIDHHISNSFCGVLAVVEPDASSTGELVAAIGAAAGLKPGSDAATCIYSSIIADTGGFRYHNTTPRGMALAAQMLECGVDKELIRIQLFESRSPAAMAMLRVALENMRVTEGGLLSYTGIRYEDMIKHGALKGDLHNIANYTLFPTGVKVGLFFEEYDGYVKLSLRGRRGWRVDLLAQEWGGGGHVLAAGCQFSGTLAEVLPSVLEKVRELLVKPD